MCAVHSLRATTHSSGRAAFAARSRLAPRHRMSGGAHRSRTAAGRRRWLTATSVALVCAIGIAVSVAEATSGGSSQQSRPRTSTGRPASGRTPEQRPTPTSSAAHSRELAVCAMPDSAAVGGGWSLIATSKSDIPRYTSPTSPQDGIILARWYGPSQLYQ
jgi:hypothetical protein